MSNRFQSITLLLYKVQFRVAFIKRIELYFVEIFRFYHKNVSCFSLQRFEKCNFHMRYKNFDFLSKRKERILFLVLLQKFVLGWNKQKWFLSFFRHMRELNKCLRCKILQEVSFPYTIFIGYWPLFCVAKSFNIYQK